MKKNVSAASKENYRLKKNVTAALERDVSVKKTVPDALKVGCQPKKNKPVTPSEGEKQKKHTNDKQTWDFPLKNNITNGTKQKLNLSSNVPITQKAGFHLEKKVQDIPREGLTHKETKSHSPRKSFSPKEDSADNLKKSFTMNKTAHDGTKNRIQVKKGMSNVLKGLLLQKRLPHDPMADLKPIESVTINDLRDKYGIQKSYHITNDKRQEILDKLAKFCEKQRNNKETMQSESTDVQDPTPKRMTVELDINKPDSVGNTPLQYAAMEGDAGAVKEFLNRGAMVDAKNKYGNTALHFASMSCSPDCVKVLLDHGADATARDNDGATPLHYAATTSLHLNELVARGADVNARDAQGNTPLHYATMWINPTCIHQLITLGAYVNCKANNGNTALHVAAGETSDRPFSMAAQGVNLYVTDSSKCRPLTLPVPVPTHWDHAECVRLARISEAQERNGEDAQVDPANVSFAACIKELVRRGANKNLKNNAGYTPLEVAVDINNEECAKQLLADDGDHDIVDVPSHIRREAETEERFRKLLAQADVPRGKRVKSVSRRVTKNQSMPTTPVPSCQDVVTRDSHTHRQTPNEQKLGLPKTAVNPKNTSGSSCLPKSPNSSPKVMTRPCTQGAAKKAIHKVAKVSSP